MSGLLITSNLNQYGTCSSNNLPRIKDGGYVINLNDKNGKETYWVSLLINKNTPVYFDCFGIKYIPQEVLTSTKDKIN